MQKLNKGLHEFLDICIICKTHYTPVLSVGPFALMFVLDNTEPFLTIFGGMVPNDTGSPQF